MRISRERFKEIVLTSIYLPTLVNFATMGNVSYVLFFGVGGAVFYVVLSCIIDRKFGRRIRVGESPAFKISREGIIFTVGMQEFTIKFALENQKPAYTGFVCSEKSFEVAEKVCKDFSIGEDRKKSKTVDPWDIKDVIKETKMLIEWMLEKGISRERIVVDVTGGLTPMSLGAFLAAMEYNIDCQYIKSEYDDNKPIPGTQEAILIRYA